MKKIIKKGIIIVGIYLLFAAYILMASNRIERLDKDENLEKVNAVKNLIIVKNNPTIGVKILCHSITLQQYLLEKQQNEEKEQMAVRIEKDKNFIKEIAASIRKVEDVITSNRVK